MRRFSMVALVVLMCTSAPAQTRALIQRQYDQFAKAYVANDVKVMLSMLAADYTLTDGSGKRLSRSAYARELRERKKAGKRSQAYTVEITALTVNGVSATVLTNEVTLNADDSRHIHRYRDTWRRVGKVWRLTSTTTLGHG